jgi:hypothetical protein
MNKRPAFSARTLQDAQKLAVKGYSCLLCPKTFPDGLNLWQHATTSHRQQLGLTDVASEGELREQFQCEAIAKAYVGASRSV